MEFLGIHRGGDWKKDPIASGGEVLLWHDDVHQRLESMQLYFWRLAFSPRYPRTKVFEGLANFYKEANINSYVAYETLGDFDLLLRVWAPRAYNAEELELLLRQSLVECSLWNLNYLACKTDLHFADNGAEADVPSTSDLDAVRVSLIDEVNQYNQLQWSRMQQPDEDASPMARPAGVVDLINNGILRTVPLDTRGIRMFVTFDHPRQPFRPQTRDHVVGEIRTKCEEVRDAWRNRTETTTAGEVMPIPCPQLSIYAGAGSMSDVLIMARAPHKHFHAFVRELIDRIRAIGLDERYEMRPYTHVVADRMFSDFREHRVVGADAGNIPKLIQKDEDRSLEFKATLATNFRSLIVADRTEKDPTMLDEVVKTVCGFLNSPGGGTLAIGVLEVRRELEKVRDPSRYLKSLEERFGYAPRSEADEETYPNAVVGIEVDIESGHFSDPDQYVRHLGDTLKSKIRPNPWPWLQIDWEEIEGRTVCLVWARPGDMWFYAQLESSQGEEFFIREGASTPALYGIDSDLYKQNYRRKSSSLNFRSEE